MRIYETYMQYICTYMIIYMLHICVYMPDIGKIEVHICAYTGHIGLLYRFFISTYKPYMYIQDMSPIWLMAGSGHFVAHISLWQLSYMMPSSYFLLSRQ